MKNIPMDDHFFYFFFVSCQLLSLFFISLSLSLTHACARAHPQLIGTLYLFYHQHEPSNTTTHLYISQSHSHSLNLPNTRNDMLRISLSRCVSVHIQKRRYQYVGMEKEVIETCFNSQFHQTLISLLSAFFYTKPVN